VTRVIWVYGDPGDPVTLVLVLVLGDLVVGEGDMVTRDHGDPGDPVTQVTL
jgi:hypothetical protein